MPMGVDNTPNYAPHPPAAELAAPLAAEIKDKTVLVTGASPASLATEFLKSVAPYGPAMLILAGRSQAKLDKTVQELTAVAPNVHTRTLVMDFNDLGTVRAAAQLANSWADVPSIDVLVLNAGVMAVPYGTTADGFETTFGVNHLSQFVFANEIMSKVIISPGGGRVVVVSSDGHAASPLRKTKEAANFDKGKTYNRWEAYGQSKTANALFALALARKLGPRGLQAYSLHPGVITTTGLGGHVEPEAWGNFVNVTDGVRASLPAERRRASTNVHTKYHDGPPKVPFKTMEHGAATYVTAAFDPSLKGQNGGYLQDAALDANAVESWASDPAEAERLWAMSEDLVGEKFEY